MLERSSVSLDDDGAVGVAEELAALHRASVDPHALKIETIGLSSTVKFLSMRTYYTDYGRK